MASTPVAGGTKAGIDKLGQPANSNIRQVVGVMSGKGGVGKSSVTALLASELARRGKRVGILDADVTGPSIPKLLGVTGTPVSLENQILPESTRTGIKVMSLNLLLEREDDPVIWRGPLLAGTVRQFWSDVLWGDLDYMVVDLPPGTGDVPLTVLQSLPIDGLVIVTSPQELSKMVVKKAVNMAGKMGVRVVGAVENMTWTKCPHCGERLEPFGKGDPEATAKDLGIPLLGSLPIDPTLSSLGDEGKIEEYRSSDVSSIADKVEEALLSGKE